MLYTSEFNPVAAAGFLPSQITAMSPRAFAAMTRETIQTLGNPYNTYKPCRGLSSAHLAVLPTEKFGSISEACVSVSATSTWTYLSPEQFSSLNPAAFGGFRIDRIHLSTAKPEGRLSFSNGPPLTPDPFPVCRNRLYRGFLLGIIAS